MGDLFGGYGAQTARRRRGRATPFDEMFGDARRAHTSETRPAYRELFAALAALTQEELRGRTDALASSYLAQGVTFDSRGRSAPSRSTPCRA